MKLAHNHPIQCRCAQVRGELRAGAIFTRAVCYCLDCQAYADVLGDPDRVLDTNGGTDIVASLQQYVRFSAGSERLGCLSLRARGMLRWYASCCNTPIANTARDPRLSYMGIVSSCLGRDAGSLDAAFGPPTVTYNAESATGDVPPDGWRTPAATLRIMS